MTQRNVFATPIPTLNQYINTERRNKFAAAKIKRDTEALLVIEMQSQKIKPVVSYPVGVAYAIYAPNKRTDKMNRLTTAVKFIEDALQTAGIIRGDGWKDLDYPSPPTFRIDKDNPRVEVALYESD